MYDYIRDELPALIKAEFTVSDRCAISGHSMGGHGALIMALKTREIHQRLCVRADCEPNAGAVGTKAFTNYLGKDEEKWQEWDSCALMLASRTEDAIPMLIDR